MYSDVIIIKNRENIDLICVNCRSSLFKEHFENFPILPGAFSVGLSVDMLLKNINGKGKKFAVHEIKKVAFLRPIGPDLSMKIDVIKETRNNEKITLRFSLNDRMDNAYIAGVIIFKELL